MADYNTITNEVWKICLPTDWAERESATDQSVYFEAPDESKGLYLSTWRFEEDPRSAGELLESFRQVELNCFKEMEGYTWQPVDEWKTDTAALAILGIDCLDRGESYRIVCQLIARLPWLVRSSFHDYNCADYEASKKFFRPIIESLEIHHDEGLQP